MLVESMIFNLSIFKIAIHMVKPTTLNSEYLRETQNLDVKWSRIQHSYCELHPKTQGLDLGNTEKDIREVIRKIADATNRSIEQVRSEMLDWEFEKLVNF